MGDNRTKAQPDDAAFIGVLHIQVYHQLIPLPNLVMTGWLTIKSK
jgi:hypothetical protein